MKRIYTYILALLALSVACQRVDLPEELLTDQPASAVGKKARISFSTAELDGIDTRALIDPTVDVHTLHLVIFDENGMLVEVCEAETLGSSDHDDHASGKHYTVELTLSDKPRVIHYIANCPVDQIVYGHEASIIGNMYVDKNDRAHKTEYETSYWARMEVPFILVQETEENGKTVVSLDSRIADKFKHVPLLRNFAEITVTSTITDGSFVMEGYTVYNVIDRGTVAPYNNKTQTFQDFIYKPEGASTFVSYTYPQLNGAPYYYEGHALSSAELIDELPKNADGTPKIFNSNEPFYVYERKISVMTDDESKWKESPAHIIIKGQYKPQGSNTANTYYYKMDLVYNVKDSQGVTTEIKYYNILRNFMYQFNLTGVHAAGYKTLEEAVAGSAGNNISGSASASKLTNVSDEHGRLWVSYTDTTLVTNNTISLKYKYIPNYYNASETSTYGKVQNGQVRFENIVGEVISGISVASTDITSGSWAGYRNVTITVNNPQSTTLKQALSLKTNNANLSREIRYTLRHKFNMAVECTPKVASSMMAPVTVDIKLPLGLTEDMFPLVLNMETYDRTLSPDAGENTIPVTAGPSIIDVEGRKGQNSFYFTVTIPTIADYNGMATVGNMKVYTTYWQTNKEANASTMYVDNKYFNQGSDSWENYSKTFSEVSISPTAIPYGAGREASVSFTMPNDDNTPVTLTLTGLEDASGNKTPITVTPTAGSSSNVTVTASGTDKVVKVTGLYTSTISDQVTVHIDADGYKDEKVTASRHSNQFVVTGFDPSMITGSGDFRNLPVTYTFTVPTYYDNMEVNVTLDGLAPADDETSLSEVNGRSAIKTYTFKPGAAGTYVLKLKTINKDACTCSLTLEAEKYYYETVTTEVKQAEVQYGYQNISVPESVAQGENKDVKIEFELDPTDANRAGKKVNVTLVGMALNGSTSPEVTANNNGKVSFTAKTTDATGPLRVTFYADGYPVVTRTINARPASIIISANKLITTLSNVNFRDNNRTISIYKENPYSNTSADVIATYQYTRQQTGGYGQYRQAYNTSDLKIDGVSVGDVIYLKYSHTSGGIGGGTTTNYYCKITITDDYNGGTYALTTTISD